MLRCIRLRYIVSGLLPTLLLGSCAAWASGFSSPVADEKTTRALSSARRLQGLDLGSFQNTYYFSSFAGDDANVCSAALPCQSYGYARGICTD